MALIQCYECKNEVSTTAKTCPKCGAKVVVPPATETPKEKNQKRMLGLAILVAGLIFAAFLSKPDQVVLSPEQQAADAETKRIAALTPDQREEEVEKKRVASLTPQQLEYQRIAKEKRVAAIKAAEQASAKKAKQDADADKKRFAALTPAQQAAESKKKIEDLAATAIADTIAKAGRPPVGEHGAYIVGTYLKKNLADPSGFRMEGCTSPALKAGSWVVDCSYVARNGFGALVHTSGTFYVRNDEVVAAN